MAFRPGKWLQALKRKAAPGAPARRGAKRTGPQRIALALEWLEDRTVPSTLTVTSAADDGSAGTLRAVIAAAPSGATIDFAHSLDGQTITLTGGELAIGKSLDVEGPGANQLTVSGNNASRVFDVSGGATNVTIRGLTIADGLVNGITAVGPFGPVTMGGGVLNTGAHVALSGVSFVNNQADGTQNGYVQTNLVSDVPGLAQLTDPNLKDPWGLAESASGPFVVADQMSSVATAYSVTAAGVSALPSQTVAVPRTGTGRDQGPTGEIFNDTNSFLVNGTPATFIFDGLNDTISAWNSSLGTTAQIEATNTGGIYTGLDIESTASGDFLYAADPRQDRIDVFDGSFHPVNLGTGAFVDPQLPAGLTPFNVEGINGDVYVSYAVPGPPHYVSPEGAGAVAVFDTGGHFLEQLISGGKLASPWGMVLAPSTFGQFGGDLLVGNFSYTAPEINAFDPVSGAYLGTLTDGSGNTLLNNGEGIWDMNFGNGGNGGLPNTLYVTTGLNAPAGVNAVPGNDGLDGLLVAIDPLPGIAQGGAVASVSGGTLDVSNCTFLDNQAVGTFRGTGGALVSDGGSALVLGQSNFTGNQAVTVGDRGPGEGAALGGAVLSAGASQASVFFTIFEGNAALGGNGADGGPGQNGGNGGNAVGGALDNDAVSMLVTPAPSTLSVAYCLFADNQAAGGAGGDEGSGGLAGGAGGAGQGGALSNLNGSSGTIADSVFLLNAATGGAGGLGGNGGNGQGGAAYNDATSSLAFRTTLIVCNSATGSAAGTGGSDGQGVGGGLYLAPGGVASADLWTVVLANHASTSDDDVFGDLGHA